MAIAIEVARQLVVFVKRSGGQAQFSIPLAGQATGGDVFDDLHAWVVANLDANLRVEQLAARACMAPRTFARLYRERTGQTLAKAVEHLRVEHARRMLEDTRHPSGLFRRTNAPSHVHSTYRRAARGLRKTFSRSQRPNGSGERIS